MKIKIMLLLLVVATAASIYEMCASRAFGTVREREIASRGADDLRQERRIGNLPGPGQTTPSARRAPVPEGVYGQHNACANFRDASTRIEWCVDAVLLDNKTMKVWCTWSSSGSPLQQGSDASNRNMFLTDGSGARLDHISTSGFARDGGVLNGDDDEQVGTYTFPAPRVGSSVFTFHDDDSHVMIPNIRLDPARYADSAALASLLRGVMNATEVVIDVDEGGWNPGIKPDPQDGHHHGTLTGQDGAVFDRLLRMLAEAPVLPGPYVAHIRHTDEYPRLSIRVRTPAEEFYFHTESQGRNHIPWAVDVKGATWVILSDAPVRAIDIVRTKWR